MSMKALFVMAKRPFPGRTKTRLVPPFSAEEATRLYEALLQDTLTLARAVPGVTPYVAYSPADRHSKAYFQKVAPDFQLISQRGLDLGERLDHVLSSGLLLGYEQVVAMNSDSPTLPVQFLEEAFQRLDDPFTDVVLGPCLDGGYYLIGWKRPHPWLVREVEMSTERVLAQTLRIAAEEGLQVALLAPWFDVDDLADLQRIRQDVGAKDVAVHTWRFVGDMVSKLERF